METVKDGSPVRLGGQQARPEPSSLEPLPLAPISMLFELWRSLINNIFAPEYDSTYRYTVHVQLYSTKLLVQEKHTVQIVPGQNPLLLAASKDEALASNESSGSRLTAQAMHGACCLGSYIIY